jgi:ankyrin repeat protein
MAGLRLDRRRDAMPSRVGANGVRIVPGNSAGSRLYQRVSATEPGKQMPPSGPLPKAKIDLLKAWIDQGADWPDALSGEKSPAPPDPVVATMSSLLREDRRSHFLRVLVDHPDAVNAKGEGGWTPLMYAALYGDAGLVRLLLEKGAKPNTQNESGGAALMYATGDVGKVKILLDRGADPNLRSGDGRTALLIALGRTGSSPVVKLLLARGADLKAAGPSALVIAASTHDPELLQLLLDRGAEKDHLPFTRTIGCEKCFDVLVKAAAPDDFSNALDIAVWMGDDATARSLLERGAKPSPGPPVLRGSPCQTAVRRLDKDFNP